MLIIVYCYKRTSPKLRSLHGHKQYIKLRITLSKGGTFCRHQYPARHCERSVAISKLHRANRIV
jgi:hypothetical protein